jgi:CheY-like chemotaxis protein
MMITCEEFEQELQEALVHLYDPDYRPSDAFHTVVGCDDREGVLDLQAAILRAIEDLKPPTTTPPTAHIKQAYDLLCNRFVLKLTQEETADRMYMSRTSVHRIQRKAVHTLARTLWERYQPPGHVSRAAAREQSIEPSREDALDIQALDWRSQMQRELASLQAKAPHTVSDMREAIDNVLEFVETLTAKLGVSVEVKSVQPGLVAAVHPVVLHQVLISALKRLACYLSDGEVAIYARLEGGNAKITLTGAIAAESGLSETDLTSGIPMSEDISAKACIDGSQVFVWIEVPSMGKVTVLVVDDNEDMARFYRSSTVGTRYHIVHITQGQDLFDAIESAVPDVIVLDVMLPDIDGWRLLMRLHEDPATRSIPIIVCSVVREEDLALSLGAARFLPKPVRPREFVHALNQAYLQAAAGTWISPMSSGEAC